MRLLLATVREMLGRWGAAALPIWILLAAVLSFDEVLGSASLGTYLAYVSLVPMAWALRLGRVRDRRVAEGWDLEERLRDPRGWRMPLAECGAAVVLLAASLGLALVPTWFSAFHVPPQDANLHPARTRDDGGGWSFRTRAPAPPGSSLILSFAFERLPPDGALTLRDDAGRTQPVVPGEILEWRLGPQQARTGHLRLRPADPDAADDAGLRVLPLLTRLRVPLPDAEELPGLLLGQFLFFWPLYSLLLLWHRRFRVGGGLSALAVLAIGGLAAARPPAETFLPESPVGWLAHAFLALRAALPEVSGLLAVGHGFELRVGTAAPVAIAAWAAVGVVALALSTNRHPTRNWTP